MQAGGRVQAGRQSKRDKGHAHCHLPAAQPEVRQAGQRLVHTSAHMHTSPPLHPPPTHTHAYSHTHTRPRAPSPACCARPSVRGAAAPGAAPPPLAGGRGAPPPRRPQRGAHRAPGEGGVARAHVHNSVVFIGALVCVRVCVCWYAARTRHGTQRMCERRFGCLCERAGVAKRGRWGEPSPAPRPTHTWLGGKGVPEEGGWEGAQSWHMPFWLNSLPTTLSLCPLQAASMDSGLSHSTATSRPWPTPGRACVRVCACVCARA